MLFLQGVHVCTACKNSSFCTALGNKMLFFQGLFINIDPGGIAFARFLRGLPTPAPAHLIGSPNPLVSRAPQTLKELSRLRGFPLSLRNA